MLSDGLVYYTPPGPKRTKEFLASDIIPADDQEIQNPARDQADSRVAKPVAVRLASNDIYHV